MSLATKLQDVLSIIFARLPCECRLPGIRPPSSPAVSAQEGELDGLLFDNLDNGDNGNPTWREEAGTTMTSRDGRTASGRTSQASYKRSRMHKPLGQRPKSAVYDSEPETEEGVLEYDDDPDSLGRATLDRLPELARRYEPTLSLEDMAREEREQEERDRREERATKLGQRFADLPTTSTDDDFGGFEQAPASVDPLGAVPIPEEDAASGPRRITSTQNADDDDDAAEVSFGLGDDASDIDS